MTKHNILTRFMMMASAFVMTYLPTTAYAVPRWATDFMDDVNEEAENADMVLRLQEHIEWFKDTLGPVDFLIGRTGEGITYAMLTWLGWVLVWGRILTFFAGRRRKKALKLLEEDPDAEIPEQVLKGEAGWSSLIFFTILSYFLSRWIYGIPYDFVFTSGLFADLVDKMDVQVWFWLAFAFLLNIQAPILMVQGLASRSFMRVLRYGSMPPDADEEIEDVTDRDEEVEDAEGDDVDEGVPDVTPISPEEPQPAPQAPPQQAQNPFDNPLFAQLGIQMPGVAAAPAGVCPACQRQLKAQDNKFCPGCGHNLAAPAPAAAPAPEPAPEPTREENTEDENEFDFGEF